MQSSRSPTVSRQQRTLGAAVFAIVILYVMWSPSEPEVVDHPSLRHDGPIQIAVNQWKPDLDRPEARFQSRVHLYCNDHPYHPNGSTDMPPAEVTFTKMVPSDLQLIQVQVAVRHGDRTSLYDPFKNPRSAAIDECSLQTSIEPSMMTQWEDIQYALAHGFDVSFDDVSDAKLQRTESALRQSLTNIMNEYKAPSSTLGCERAHLTAKGVLQHLENGVLLRTAYGNALGLASEEPHQMATEGKLRVVATAFHRTVVSAASIITGIFTAAHHIHPDTSGKPWSPDAFRRLNIELCDESEDCPWFAHKYVRQRCPKASGSTHPSNQVSNVWGSLNPSILRQTAAVLVNRDDILTLPMSHYVDGMMTRLCHGYNGVVCDKDSVTSHTCLPVPDALALINAGDVEFLDRFTRPYTRILMYPAFRDMVDSMKLAVEGRTPLKLQVIASHDTVISPMLAVLGVSDGRWPPYASRLVFELWKSKSTGDGFIRVIYNGVDVTPRLACRAFPPQPSHGLCTLSSFEVQVQDMLFPFSTYEEACSA